MKRAIIKGIGGYLPEKILTNEDLSKIVDTNDEWITLRTGIKQRHISAENEHVSDLGFKASVKAIDNAGINKDEIDLVILATTTPDNIFPSSATKVTTLLGLQNVPAFDMQAVCTGFVYAMATADSFIKSGQYKTILVIGGDRLSSIVDWQDRGTCILFGDGAGAVILQAEESDSGILGSNLFSDGNTRDLLYVDGGVSQEKKDGVIKMDGKEVFKNAVQKMTDSALELVEKCNLKLDDIDYIIPHQANLRILNSVAKKLGVGKERLIATVDKHANTSAASIPLAMYESYKKFKKGDLLLLQAIGGGLTWGSCLVRL